jgi:Tfp pilus assembly protein PilF
LGEFARGVQFSRKALDISPKNACVWDTLACNLVGAGDKPEALKAFTKAIELKKSDRDISWPILARLYEDLGMSGQAREARQKSQSLVE